MKNITRERLIATIAVSVLSVGMWGLRSNEARAQSGQRSVDIPEFKVDPFWPKSLPNRWVTAEVGGVCVDAQDHVFVASRGNLDDKEKGMAKVAPPIIEFDQSGNVVNSWGNRELMPKTLHGCFVDSEGNVWIAGNGDAIVQKYSHDGKMLLQIGTKGKFDSSDGTDSMSGGGLRAAAMNSSHELLNSPTGIAVDPANGDVYISDGYGNRRVVVFDRQGHYLRQWGRQGTMAETDAGVGGVFVREVHCVALSNDGLVYVCDRWGNRVEVFDKMGKFQRNIPVESKTARAAGLGSTCAVAFSRDPAQKFLYVGNCADAEVRIIERATGKPLSAFGQPGHLAGEFADSHSLTVDSKGDLIVGEGPMGRRVQMFRLAK